MTTKVGGLRCRTGSPQEAYLSVLRLQVADRWAVDALARGRRGNRDSQRAIASMYWRKIPTLPAIGALALTYFCAGKLGLFAATLHRSASPVWPPAGIALAALLLGGYRLLPAIFLGAFVVNITTAGNILTSLGIASGNTCEALCAAWLIDRFARGAEAFDRAENVFKFALFAALGCVFAPTFGVTSLALAGFASWASYGGIWLTWWLGDITGVLIVTPLILLWALQPHWRLRATRKAEVAVLLLLLIVIGEIVFGGWFPIRARNYPIAFICGPVVIWTAFRLSQRETATAILILAALSLVGTVYGYGPFVMETENHSLLIVQTWTAVLSITAMALAAAVSEQHATEAAIEQQRAAVEAANKTKDNFLAMLSHELRTPLTPVLAALDGLDSSATSTESKAALAMIRRNVELESQLIDDLLDLTRIARHKLQLRFDVLDAHTAITDVVEMCRGDATARRLQIHVNLRAGAHYLSADPAKFRQIIWNLLKNAIKFTSAEGEITIMTGNPDAQMLEIKVVDTGIGIKPEIMKRMFDPFEQGDLSFQHRYGGLGLGLAISKSLAQAHGGSLTAESPGLNQGSTFTFRMNTVSPRVERPLSSAQPPNRAAADVTALRILLVDDHEDTCTALERLLVRRGHLVAAAHDMQSAMAAATRSEFDLLISDIALPDGTGTELMAYLRAMSGIRGIAISGFGMNGDIEKSLQAGFSEHLVKPLKIERLEEAIERVIAR
jgi:signal transduction histidine kinase